MVRLKEKLSLIIFGIFCCVFLLEVGMRIAGSIMILLQERRNSPVAQGGREYRIMCLGESTTAAGGRHSWPSQLEEILNASQEKVRFRVINKGRYSVDSTAVLADLEENIDNHRPDMIITMMGINDGALFMPFNDHAQPKIVRFFSNLKVVKLLKFIKLHLEHKLKEEEVSVEQEAERQVSVSPDDTEGLFLSALQYRVEGKYEDAILLLEKAIELHPREWKNYHMLVVCYLDQGKYEEVEELLSRIFHDFSHLAEPYILLANCYRDHGINDAAREELLLQAIEVAPENTHAMIELANYYVDNSKLKEAEALFKKAAAIDLKAATSDSRRSIIGLGEHYAKQRDSGGLEDLIKTISKSSIEDDRLYGFSAVFHLQKNDLEAAQKDFQRAEDLRSAYYSPVTRHNYLKLQEIVFSRNIRLTCVQYPMRKVEPLIKLFDSAKGIVFVDNEKIFKDAVSSGSYEDYFVDNFAGDFGHCTPQGNRLLAENIARTISKGSWKQ